MSHFERRDAMAFAMAEAGDTTAVSTLQRIIARDPDEKKVERAKKLIGRLERAGEELTNES